MRISGWLFTRMVHAPDGAGGSGGAAGAPGGTPAGDAAAKGSDAGKGADAAGKAPGSGAAGPTDVGGNAFTGKPPSKAALTPPTPGDAAKKRTRPDFIPEKHWDPETGTVKIRDLAQSYNEIQRKLSMRTEDLRKADAEDRKKLLPKEPKEYVPRLRKEYVEKAKANGITLDADKAVSFDDPMMRMLAVAAHRHGLDQEAFQDIATLYHHTRSMQAPDPVAERMKLGEHGAERAANVHRQLTQRLGKERTAALIRGAGGPTAEFVETMEMLLKGAGVTMPVHGVVGSGDAALDRAKLRGLQASDAYQNKSHPNHAEVVRAVKDGYAKLFGSRPYMPGIDHSRRRAG